MWPIVQTIRWHLVCHSADWVRILAASIACIPVVANHLSYPPSLSTSLCVRLSIFPPLPSVLMARLVCLYNSLSIPLSLCIRVYFCLSSFLGASLYLFVHISLYIPLPLPLARTLSVSPYCSVSGRVHWWRRNQTNVRAPQGHRAPHGRELQVTLHGRPVRRKRLSLLVLRHTAHLKPLGASPNEHVFTGVASVVPAIC